MTLSFHQKQSMYKTSFQFGEEELSYSFDTSRRKVGGYIAYHEIGRHVTYAKGHFWKVKYVVLSYMIFCLLAWARCTNSVAPVANEVIQAIETVGGIVVIIIGVLYMKRRIGITTIIAKTPINILDDGQQQSILDAIWQHRKDALRRKYAQVDFDRAFYQEASKFKWLKNENIISEQEYQQARQKIAGMKEKSLLSTPTATHQIN